MGIIAPLRFADCCSVSRWLWSGWWRWRLVGLESVGESVGLGQVRRELVPGLVGLPVQALEAEQVPGAQQWPEDLVVVDAQVRDAGLGHLPGLAGEARDGDPGHGEAEHLSADRLDRGRGSSWRAAATMSR
jgi:hypothetical protein